MASAWFEERVKVVRWASRFRCHPQLSEIYCAVHGFMPSLVDELQGEARSTDRQAAQVPRDLTRMSFGGIRPIIMKKSDNAEPCGISLRRAGLAALGLT